MLKGTINSLSFNSEAYNKQFIGYMGKEVSKKTSKNLQDEKDKFVELSFVDAMFEMCKLRWTILRARDELIAKGVLKKYKHLDGSVEKSSHWRSDALEKMSKEYNEERVR